jgi:hypothetical protein
MNPRRQFLHATAALGATLLFRPLQAQTPEEAPLPPIPNRPPPLAPDLVKEFVFAAHGDLAKTQAMLAGQPGLLNATWDWGGGDYETALGGASHMGRRDVAQYLLAQGARPDIFVLAMLGDLEAVKAIIAARPEALRCPGPHGIPLLAHAKKGGAEAAAVADYLQRLTTAG